MKQRLLTLWLPVVLWMTLIFMGSHQQGLPSPQSHILDVLIKKTGHILEYAVLGLLLLRAWRGTLQRVQARDAGTGDPQPAIAASAVKISSLLSVLTGGLYAFSDELHQMFVPTRSGNARDVVIDTLAVTGAVALAWLWARARSHSPRQS